MHQHPRPAPRSASAASNPSTNPERTNNQREAPPPRTRSSVDLASYTERAAGEAAAEGNRAAYAGSTNEKEMNKLNQIIQHFHSKAALTICSSRASLPQVRNRNGDVKQNRWFNIVLDDTDVLFDDLHDWKRSDLADHKPPPLIVETYVDSSQLTNNQALVIHDEAGKRWDVADALASSTGSSPPPTKNGCRFSEVLLERWTIELGDPTQYSAAELGDLLPNVYKKGVVLFRALYSFARFLPAWKLHRKLSRQGGNGQALKIKFRIRPGGGSAPSLDTLSTPLCPSDRAGGNLVTETHDFTPLLCPAGPLSISVQYRNNCELSVADAEALLSSRFLGLDESLPTLAGRSLPQARSAYTGVDRPIAADTSSARRGIGGAYGSLGTYQLASQRPVSRQGSQQSVTTIDRMNSLNSRKNEVQIGKRATPQDLISNPPFKAGSISSSPKRSPMPSPSPGTSASRPSSYLGGTSHQKRVSLNTLPQQALRQPSITNDTAIASSGSTSPRPTFSSSFAGRQRWQGSQGQRQVESNASSGRGSRSSKEKIAGAQPKGGTPGSSGSLGGTSGPADDDYQEIADFISQLERTTKDRPTQSQRPISAGGYTINLAKYSSMREAGSQLAEDMQSSSLIQTSSTPPSRRLSNVPALSTSCSPSRALAHTPHVRSRLSTHSIAEEGAGAATTMSSARSGEVSDGTPVREEPGHGEEEDELPFIFAQEDV